MNQEELNAEVEETLATPSINPEAPVSNISSESFSEPSTNLNEVSPASQEEDLPEWLR
jgi:hypothetical protein